MRSLKPSPAGPHVHYPGQYPLPKGFGGGT